MVGGAPASIATELCGAVVARVPVRKVLRISGSSPRGIDPPPPGSHTTAWSYSPRCESLPSYRSSPSGGSMRTMGSRLRPAGIKPNQTRPSLTGMPARLQRSIQRYWLPDSGGKFMTLLFRITTDPCIQAADLHAAPTCNCGTIDIRAKPHIRFLIFIKLLCFWFRRLILN
jgi:hypothetical protein